MARFGFGGTTADFVFSTYPLLGRDLVATQVARLTFWSAPSGGTRYTSLVVNGVASDSVTTTPDGLIPWFQGPDGVTAMWADVGGGAPRLFLQVTPASALASANSAATAAEASAQVAANSAAAAAADFVSRTATDRAAVAEGVAYVQARVLEDLGTSDGQVAALFATTASAAARTAASRFAAVFGVDPSYGDGETDATEHIQSRIDAAAAFAGGGIVDVPPGAYMIQAHVPSLTSSDPLGDAGGLALRDNVHLRLSPQTRLQAIANDKPQYQVVRVWAKSNVRISGGEIVGERDDHTGSTGEYGYGITIAGGCNGVVIQDVKLTDFWGDGIVVVRSATSRTVVPKRIAIDGVECRGNRRQGMSVIGVDGLLVTRSTFADTAGTAPQCGVDIEPEHADVTNRDITFRDCVFSGNASSGLEAVYGTVDNLTIDDCVFAGNGGAGGQITLTMESGEGVEIRNTLVRDTEATTGVRLHGISDVKITDSRIEGGVVWSADEESGITAGRIEGSVIKSHDAGYGVTVGRHVDGVHIDRSTITAPAGGSMESALVLAGCRDIQVTRSRLRDSSGILVLVTKSSGDSCADVVVTDSGLDNAGSLLLYSDGVNGITLRGNRLAGASATTSGGAMVSFDSGTTRPRVEGNDFFRAPRVGSPGSGRPARAVAWNQATVGDIVTSGNRCHPSASTALPLHGTLSLPVTTGHIGNERGVMVCSTDVRPSSPVPSSEYYDTTLKQFVRYDGEAWRTPDGTPR